MITASDFLKWLQIFNVVYGPNVIALPVSMAQGGTGAALTPTANSILVSGASTVYLLASANNGVLVTGASGIPAISSTLPSGLTIPGYLLLAGGTMSGQLSLNGPPLTDSAAATKLYVDQITSGLPPTGPVDAASTGNFASTYNNGTAGVGATLTASSTGVVVLDGITTVLNGIYLFKDQTDTTQNGIYNCTIAGALGVAGVFTRNNHYDTPPAINNSGITPVINGSTQAGEGWYEINDVVNIGADPIVFVRFGNSGTVTSITAGTGLDGGTITGSGTISLTIPVVVSSGGTGLTALTAHNLLIGAGTTTTLLAPSATAGVALVSAGASADPVYSTVVVGGGGTGITTTTAWGLICGGTTATGNFQNAGTGATGTLLQGAGAAALPTWTTTTYPVTNAINTIMYASAANVLGVITPVNNAWLTTNGSGVPAWSTTLPANFTLTTPNIIGVTDGSNAAAGSVGEFFSSVISSASAVSMTVNVPNTVTSISLTAGDWDVWGNIDAIGTGLNLPTITTWISSSTSLPDSSLYDNNTQYSATINGNIGCRPPSLRFSLSTTTTIYLQLQWGAAAGSLTACGGIYARRRR